MFIYSFQFLSSSSDNICKNMSKDGFDYLISISKVLELFKKRGSYPYEYMSEFQNFKKNYIVFSLVKKLVTKI